MGTWLSKYGNAIYNTKGGPYVPGQTYATTRKGNKIFLHIFERNADTLDLPALPATKITKAYFMNGAVIAVSQKPGGRIIINLPRIMPDTISSVIVLELDKNAEQLPVIRG
jgi:alpha-L-fucosidase